MELGQNRERKAWTGAGITVDTPSAGRGVANSHVYRLKDQLLKRGSYEWIICFYNSSAKQTVWFMRAGDFNHFFRRVAEDPYRRNAFQGPFLNDAVQRREGWIQGLNLIKITRHTGASQALLEAYPYITKTCLISHLISHLPDTFSQWTGPAFYKHKMLLLRTDSLWKSLRSLSNAAPFPAAMQGSTFGAARLPSGTLRSWCMAEDGNWSACPIPCLFPLHLEPGIMFNLMQSSAHHFTCAEASVQAQLPMHFSRECTMASSHPGTSWVSITGTAAGLPPQEDWRKDLRALLLILWHLSSFVIGRVHAAACIECLKQKNRVKALHNPISYNHFITPTSLWKDGILTWYLLFQKSLCFTHNNLSRSLRLKHTLRPDIPPRTLKINNNWSLQVQWQGRKTSESAHEVRNNCSFNLVHVACT